MDPVSASIDLSAFWPCEARKIQQSSGRCVMPRNAEELSFCWNAVGVKLSGRGIEKSHRKIAEEGIDTNRVFAGLFLQQYLLPGQDIVPGAWRTRR